MEIHDSRTAPIRQTMSNVLGGTMLTFAMLLGFVNPSWALQVSPGALTFSATTGGNDPSPQTVVLSSSRTRERTCTATENAPWITVTPSSGTIAAETDSVSVRATTAGLAAGSYSANVMITETSQNGRIRRTILPVTLSVAGAAAAPAIQLSVSSLAFSGAAGAANPAAQTIGVSNTGSGTLTWTASDNAAWLTLTPASGTNAGTIAASVNMAGLAAGTYNTTISVAATGTATKSLPVTLTVTNSSPTSGITTSPSPIAFTGTVGPGPLTVPVTFTNTGATSVNFTWTDSISWISAGYPAGTLSPGQSVTYSMTANISGMAAGSYYGIATVTAGGITKQVPVTLALTTATSTAAIGLNTTSLGFAGTVGGTNPSAQTIAVSNVGGGTLS